MTQHQSYLRDTPGFGQALAEKYEVITDIHLDDWIFSHLYAMFGNDLEKTLDIYLNSGKVSSEKIRDIIADLQGATVVNGKIREAMTILDFASGYGCVARHMHNVVPAGKVVAMDIHDKAKYFNSTNLHVQAALSDTDPANVDAFFQFDVVFCLSFFSHMPRARIAPWLRKLVEFVKLGGIFLFTTHGITTHRNHLAHLKVDDKGYAFERTSEQKDLSLDDYGNAITYPLLIFKELDNIATIELMMFRGASWWTHQDVYVVRKVRT